MIDFLTAPFGQDAPNTVNVVLEVTRSSATQYERRSRVFRPVEPLNPPVHFPGNYGFIPQTLGANGEPLRALILGDESPYAGWITRVRPIGAVEIVDDGVPVERVVACAALNPLFRAIRNYTDAPSGLLQEIEHVLSLHRDYKRTYAEILGWKDCRAAQESIWVSHTRFVSH